MGNLPLSNCCFRNAKKHKEEELKEETFENKELQPIKQTSPNNLTQLPTNETEREEIHKHEDSNLNDPYFVYQQGDLIGIGPHGKVFESMNIHNVRFYACKYISCQKESRKKFICYLDKKLLELEHENIINYFTIAENINNPEEFMIVSELCSAGSLGTLLLNLKVLDEKILKLITKQILEGLNYLNTRGFAHSNLHPNNVLFDLCGKLKLNDYFSLKSKEILTNSSMLVDLMCYLAPETLLFGEKTQKSDIWAVGCLIFEMATGIKPWNDNNKNAEFIKNELKTGNFFKIPDTLSKDLCNFLGRILQIQEEKRPTAEELLNDDFLKELNEKEEILPLSENENQMKFRLIFSKDQLSNKDDNDLAKEKNLFYKKMYLKTILKNEESERKSTYRKKRQVIVFENEEEKAKCEKEAIEMLKENNC